MAHAAPAAEEELRVTAAESPADLEQVAKLVREHLPDVDPRQVNFLVKSADTDKFFMKKGDGELLGLTTYRVHEDADFVDVQFFLTTRHMEGFGRRFFNLLKPRFAEFGVSYVVLYTGQNAVGFFQKLGFVDKSDLDQSLVTPRVEVFGNAVRLTYDLTDEFAAPHAAQLAQTTRVGDKVLLKHGLRFQTWREAWVIEKRGLKVRVKYTDAKNATEWVPVASQRLLTDGAGSVDVDEKPEKKRKAEGRSPAGKQQRKDSG